MCARAVVLWLLCASLAPSATNVTAMRRLTHSQYNHAVHEHAEANSHKNNGLACVVAGHAVKLVTGLHSKMTGTVGDLHFTLADDVMGDGLKQFPTADHKHGGIAGA
jgi:hypothetical protein